MASYDDSTSSHLASRQISLHATTTQPERGGHGESPGELDGELDDMAPLREAPTPIHVNCLFSTILLGLLCCHGCSVERLTAKFAFLPPSPSTYRLLGKIEDGDEEENDDAEHERDGVDCVNSFSAVAFNYKELSVDPIYSQFGNLASLGTTCTVVRTKGRPGHLVPCFHFQPKTPPPPVRADGDQEGQILRPRKPPLLLILAHGNATDCGAMLPFYLALRERLGVAVMGVEYVGYGPGYTLPNQQPRSPTSGPSVNSPQVHAQHQQPTQEGSHGGGDGSAVEALGPLPSTATASLEAAYQFAVQKLGYSPSQIVLYGQSIGSGPVCAVLEKQASAVAVWRRRQKLWRQQRQKQSGKPAPEEETDGKEQGGELLAGVVLHSPIASGIRTMTTDGPCSPVRTYRCLDPFNNYRRVVSAPGVPVLILHGTQDDQVPLSHGELLADRRRSLRPSPNPIDRVCWVRGGGHSDIPEDFPEVYFSALKSFLESLQEK